jgi:Tol biopolymer transport system component
MRARTSWLLGLVLTLSGVSATAAATAGPRSEPHPTQHGLGGSRLYWSQFADFHFSTARIVSADAHGRHLRVLTHPAEGLVDVDPKVSPDGTRVLFERDLPDGTTRVGLVNADGTGERLLDVPCADPCVALIGPTWGPDGNHVYVSRVLGPFNDNGDAASAALWRTDLHGHHLTRISVQAIDGRFEDYAATFAPAGYVVFLRGRDTPSFRTAAFRMDPDGSHVRRLTRWSLDADELSVSPAATGPTRDLVVFETFGHGHPDGTAQAVATVSAAPREGPRFGRVRYLAGPRAPVENNNPAWSPDGRRIAWVRVSFDETADPSVSGNIWRMRWDGTHKTRVSRSPLFEFRPAWGPRIH